VVNQNLTAKQIIVHARSHCASEDSAQCDTDMEDAGED
jgi:hypothetical protein